MKEKVVMTDASLILKDNKRMPREISFGKAKELLSEKENEHIIMLCGNVDGRYYWSTLVLKITEFQGKHVVESTNMIFEIQ